MENCHDCFYACKAAVRINVWLRLESVVWLGLPFGIFLRLGLVSGRLVLSRYLISRCDTYRVAILVYRVSQCLDLQFVYDRNANCMTMVQHISQTGGGGPKHYGTFF